ncbi:MAG: hypothetical protein M9964_04290 [Solirubrobacterales bacterium]|nr:hypothetical protein [Solirubrobacterales bacterium]
MPLMNAMHVTSQRRCALAPAGRGQSCARVAPSGRASKATRHSGEAAFDL